MASIKIDDPKFEKPITYYMDDRLKKNFDEKTIPSLQKKDKDCVLVIDGAEGAGKSTLAFQIGRYVDPSLDLSRVTFNPIDFRKAIFKAKKGQCIIYDEAFTGLSSRASLSGINRALVSLMMQMRQKNLFVIVILPTFFLLDKYVAIWRARALIHVYESSGRRGYFRLYNRKLKKYLYLAGKVTYSYKHKKVFTRFRGRFYGVFALGDEEYEEKYKIRKSKALEATEKNPMTAGQVKYMEQRDILVFLVRKLNKLTFMEMSNLLGQYDLEMSHAQIANICSKFGIRGTYRDEFAKKYDEITPELPKKEISNEK